MGLGVVLWSSMNSEVRFSGGWKWISLMTTGGVA